MVLLLFKMWSLESTTRHVHYRCAYSWYTVFSMLFLRPLVPHPAVIPLCDVLETWRLAKWSPPPPCLALPSLPLSFKPLELKHLCSAMFCQARNKNVSSAGAPEKSSVHFCFLISSVGEVFSAVCLCWGIVFDQAFCTLYLLPAAVCFPSAWLRGSQCVDVSFWVKRKLTVTLNVTLRPWPCSQAHVM